MHPVPIRMTPSKIHMQEMELKRTGRGRIFSLVTLGSFVQLRVALTSLNILTLCLQQR